MSLNRLCLVLNASYEAINVTSARRALTLVFKGAAVMEEVSAFTIRAAKINVQEMENVVFEGAEAAVARLNLAAIPPEATLQLVRTANPDILELSLIRL